MRRYHLGRVLGYAASGAALIVLAAAALLAFAWRERPPPGDLGLEVAEPATGVVDGVSVTWLGVTTLLFDDGETQIMTDATISRFSLPRILLRRPLESDLAAVNRVLDEFDVDRLKAIVPLHSHFDHVIDAGHVANRTGAMVLGSESTTNVARGSGVPVDQYQTLQFGESRYFGKFTITLLPSRHVAQLPGGGHFFSGIIDQPLEQPAPVDAWQSGATFSLVIRHPAGTALVQGSAGFVAGELADTEAEVVFLSVAGLGRLGRGYARRYWDELVAATGASRVYPVHFDDFTRRFGELALLPRFVDDTATTASWLRDFAADAEPPVEILLPPLGRPVRLFEAGGPAGP